MWPFQMQGGRETYHFGPFALDPERRRLSRGQEPLWLQHRVMDVLVLLVANAGQIVSKDLLTERVWQDVAVTDNTIVQAVRALRQALGCQPGEDRYIETLVGKGYRFVAPVQSAAADRSGGDPQALLDPIRAFVQGRAALETLDPGKLIHAREEFERALGLDPGLAAAHIGLANVCLLNFESTRADMAPDRSPLQQAERYALDACRLSPSSADAWATLALVKERCGDAPEAVVAARKAVTLEPGNAFHHLRQASVSWGEERLRAAQRAQALCPGLALAHWFAATVFVARGMFERALEELREGCEAQDAQRAASAARFPPQGTASSRSGREGRPTASRFPAVGLFWLRGLVLAATGAEDEAFTAFERELAFEDTGNVYAREACANTWYATGALHLCAGRHKEATAAFHEALTRVPGHPMALIASGASRSTARGSVEAAIAVAGSLVLPYVGRPFRATAPHEEAAKVCGEALVQAEAGSAGWLLPVEPLLHPTAHRDVWAPTLALLRARAV